jgi:ABC-type transporter Mla MlaB component
MSSVSVERLGNGRFAIRGCLGFATAAELFAQTDDLLGGGGPLTLDLEAVKHVDIAGLAVLVEWTGRAQRNRQPVCLINAPGQLLALATISEVEGLLFDQKS